MIKITLAGIATLVVATASLGAQVFVATYNLSGGGNDVASFAYNGTNVANVTEGALLKNGITSSSSTGNFRGTNWPTGATTGSDVFTGSINLSSYIGFTFTADSGYELDLSSLTFGVGRSGTGPRQWEWRSSVDSFASTISTYTTVNAGLTISSGVLTNPDTNSSWTGNVLNLSGASYQNLSTITFRLYGYNTEGTAGTGGLEGNLSLNGTVAAIPEPSTYALLGLGLGGIALLRRRVCPAV